MKNKLWSNPTSGDGWHRRTLTGAVEVAIGRWMDRSTAPGVVPVLGGSRAAETVSRVAHE